MRTLYILCTFLVVCLASVNPGIPDERSETRKAINYINNFDFHAADAIIDTIIKNAPRSIYMNFLLSYKLYWRFILSDYDKQRTGEFKDSVLKTIALCETPGFSRDKDAMLFKACSYLFLALIYKEMNDMLKTYSFLQKGIDTAKQSRKFYPGVADISLILGCHSYYQPFKDHNYIIELENAAQNGYFFSTLSAFMTGKFLQEQNTGWEKSLHIFSGLYKRFPGNLLLLFHLAKSYQHTGQFREGIDCYKRVTASIHINPLPVELICRSYFSAGQIFENNLHDYKSAVLEYYRAIQSAQAGTGKTAWFIPLGNLHIGKCYARLRNFDLALLYLEKVRAEDDRKAYRQAQEMIKKVKQDRKK